MLRFPHHGNFSRKWLRPAALSALFLGPLILAQPAAAQDVSETPGEEIVVNLATGRVIIAVVKDAILIATIENPIEPQTHPPIPVELNIRRAGVMLGAVDWFSPSSDLELARLDRELPRLRGHFASQAAGPHLEQAGPNVEATDIESVGQGLFERLNVVAGDLHAKLDWPSDEPVRRTHRRRLHPELRPGSLAAHLFAAAGNAAHRFLRHARFSSDLFTVLAPEKGQPHTLVEFQYPPDKTLPTLLDLLRQKDPRIQKICDSDAKMREVADHFLEGDSNKILSVDATQFLRAALAVMSPPNARQTMASITVEDGFNWILKPPAEPKRPTTAKKAPEQQQQQEEAPSLLKPSSPD